MAEPVRFSVVHGTDTIVGPPPGDEHPRDRTSPDGCPGLATSFRAERDDGYERLYTLEAYAVTCEPESTGLGNGHHGEYRTPDDIDRESATDLHVVPTALGPASVFGEKYYECTNECETYAVPTAVITLEHPVDARFPSLIVRSADHQVRDGDADLDTLVDFVQDQLRP